MQTLDCIRTRRSIRKFTDEPVSHEVLGQIIESASFSPSWKNTQIVRYIAIESKDLKDRVADECASFFSHNADIMKVAPMLIAVTVIKGRSGFERDGSFTTDKKDGWQMYDAGIASQTLCLAANEFGLGTVIMGIIAPTLPDLLEIPEDRELVSIICIGHPAEAPEMPKRKAVDDILIYK